MVLPRDVRQAKLTELRGQSGKAVGQHKLYYKADNHTYPVFPIDLDLLVYNKHNGRLESEMLTWQIEHDVGDDGYDDELDKIIDNFLWHDNVTRNRRTLEDLRQKRQQRPAIVTLDGVIIDGNRRAMLLRRLSKEEKQYLEAVILPDAYDENETEIVRLETQYQLGEDAKLDYGPLEKYLHVKRLKHHLGIDEAEIAQLMGETEGEIRKLLGIMELMDDYLAHIRCDGLYNMLKEEDGSTKEGMFVDLYQDLRRLEGGNPQIAWPYEVLDVLDLQRIQFDYIRFGDDFSDTNKTYRAISHSSKGRNFFAQEDIWRDFSAAHQSDVDTITAAEPDLDTYCAQHPHLQSRQDAARARDRDWKDQGALYT